MSPIHWQKSDDKPSKIAVPQPSDPVWFSISLALLGLIIGFGLGKWHVGPSVAGAPTPTPPIAVDAPSDASSDSSASVGLPPDVQMTTDHIRGDKSAPIALVEYADLECPFCKMVHPTIKQVLASNPTKVMWVYREYPLSFHENGQKEAEAAECVAYLGGNDVFWKFVDAIYDKTTSNGTGFALADLAPLAKQLGVNEASFTSCLDSGKFTQRVNDSENAAGQAGVQGTPGNFLINLKTKKMVYIDGAYPAADFQKAIDGLLK